MAKDWRRRGGGKTDVLVQFGKTGSRSFDEYLSPP